MAPLGPRERCRNVRITARSGIALGLKKRRRAAALQGALRALREDACLLLQAGCRLSEQRWL